MRISIKIAFVLLLVLVLESCSKVPITGRRQLSLFPESQMVEMSATSYGEFLSENPPLPESNADAQLVEKVGLKISAAVEQYLNNHGHSKLLEDFEWKYNTVDDPTINAWCMPGGRVVFYTGILEVCEDETGIAVVMGHEIAHAVAKHGNERMSHAMGINAAGATLQVFLETNPTEANDLLMQSYGIGTGLGSLAFSRSHESEADKMGLVFMAMAGYDPREAPKFWERMSELGGEKPPEFMSTHPSDATRSSDLELFMPEAMKYYEKD